VLLAGGTINGWQRHLIICFSVVALYWSGMVLNDIYDVERDRAEGRNRPLATGRISPRAAWRCVFILMASGILLAFVAGQLQSDSIERTLVPGAVAIAVTLAIWLYDGPLKRTCWGPLMMGSCRMGSFLLGASVVHGLSDSSRQTVLLAGLGMGLFIAGVTLVGRNEALATGDKTWGPTLGVFISMIGIIFIGMFPYLSNEGKGNWKIDANFGYPLLIGCLGLRLVYRGGLAIQEPVPARLQRFVRTGVLLVIPFSAAISLLAAGPAAGLAVLALSLPATLLARQFHVT
jgi:4-hydroxybenzoate polyprenyltransferase